MEATLILFAVFALVVLASTVFWGWTLLDAARRPRSQWEAAGQEKTLWVVAIVVLGVTGSVAYLLVPRPRLVRVRDAAATSFDPTNFGVPEGGAIYGADGFEQPGR